MIYWNYIAKPKWKQTALNSIKVVSMFVIPATIKCYLHNHANDLE
jgi:hypothetical protein